MREKFCEEKIISDAVAALAAEQFEVWFQPQYNHISGALIGTEALVRWRHPQNGLIAPAQFIPLFETNGFLYELDKYVWEKTCRLLRCWLDDNQTPVPGFRQSSRTVILIQPIFSIFSRTNGTYRIPAGFCALNTESAFFRASEQNISL